MHHASCGCSEHLRHVEIIIIKISKVLMAGELQYRAMDVGKGIGFDHYTQSANEESFKERL